MAKSDANKAKAQFIFEQVFEALNLEWVGPEFDFDCDSYKARIQTGDFKGRLIYISVERLEDRNRDVSAESIKQELLQQLRQV